MSVGAVCVEIQSRWEFSTRKPIEIGTGRFGHPSLIGLCQLQQSILVIPEKKRMLKNKIHIHVQSFQFHQLHVYNPKRIGNSLLFPCLNAFLIVFRQIGLGKQC